jgi:hypothetical protein
LILQYEKELNDNKLKSYKQTKYVNMSSDDLVSTLPETEQWLLNCFINRFLPKCNNRRKYVHNEFFFIYTLVLEIFSHFRNVKVTSGDLLLCMAGLGYPIYVRDHPVGCKQPLKSQSKKGNRNIIGSAIDIDCIMYIGISSVSVMNLKKAVGSLAYQKNPSKIKHLATLKKEIHDFFKWNKKAAS